MVGGFFVCLVRSVMSFFRMAAGAFGDGAGSTVGRGEANRRSEVPGGEVGRLQAVEDWPPLQREALELANIFVFINT